MKKIDNDLISENGASGERRSDEGERCVIDGDGVEYGVRDGKLVLVRCRNGMLTRYSVVPGTVAILKEAFGEKVYLKEIKIPDSVEIIENYAFYGCMALQKIQMSVNLKTIGNGAFSWCRSLRRIELPETLTTIMGNPFRMCNIDIISKSPYIKVDGKLLIDGTKAICQVKMPTSIKLPEYVTEIGESACEKNLRLEKLVLPEGLRVIGKKAFLECHALRYMNMPDTVTTIDDEAFAACNFWRFTFPKSLKYIGWDALWGYTLLSVVIPGNLHIVNANTLPKKTIDEIDDIIISCTADKSKNNGIRRRFRNLLGEELYEKVKVINAMLPVVAK